MLLAHWCEGSLQQVNLLLKKGIKGRTNLKDQIMSCLYWLFLEVKQYMSMALLWNAVRLKIILLIIMLGKSFLIQHIPLLLKCELLSTTSTANATTQDL